MEITEVRIKLMDDGGDRLQAFCSITFDDCFVVRDLKIIEGTNGPFVAMPSRKLTAHCPNCGCKNHLRAPYCNQCGNRLDVDRAERDADGRTKLYADIAHPINSECREMIQDRIIAEFEAEMDRSQQPGYFSRYDDYDCGPEDDFDQQEQSPVHAVEANRFQSPHAPRPPHQAPTGSRPSGPKSRTGPKSRSGPKSRTGSQRESSGSSAPGPHKPKQQKSNKTQGEFGAGIFD